MILPLPRETPLIPRQRAAFVAQSATHFPIRALRADVFTDKPGSMRVLEEPGFARAGLDTGTSAARLEPAPIVLYRLDIPARKA
ncbi:hypothetical protein RNZ50_08835 [Paracoccaceae bacterium Fryx2]|nr:hypothetical protein [Paracoccaceae bacterium Fryx2]